MSDLAKWKVHGPVQALKTQTATWDSKQNDWQSFLHFTVTFFRPDGSLDAMETHNADGSIHHSRYFYDSAGRMFESDMWTDDGPVSKAVFFYDADGHHIRTASLSNDGSYQDQETCSYDRSGRKTKVSFLPHTEIPATCEPGKGCGATINYGIEGTDVSYSAPGAATMTTVYDKDDLPSDVLFHDADHNVVGHVVFTRDSAGRLLKEEMHFGEASPFQNIIDKASPEEREATATLLSIAVGETFSSTTYVYDTLGRMIERTFAMGNLGGDRTTYRYDDHDDPIEETTEHRSREANLDETGNVHYSDDKVNVQHTRLEYHYDSHGNWTEKIVSTRSDSATNFERSNMESRVITYYG